jgi:flagellar L-ring protein FlgH
MSDNPGRFRRKPFPCLRFAALALAAACLAACAHMAPDKTASKAMIPPQRPPAATMTALPEAGPQPASLAPTGSLWAASNTSLFQDIKAHRVGDTITITVSEEATASKAASTIAQRDKTLSGNFSFAGVGVNGAPAKGALQVGPYDGKFSNGFSGTGTTTKTDSMTAYMTATVVDVLPTGNLFIRGARWTKVNDEMQQMVLEGIVRPADINRNNSVLSQNVAEAKIFYVGKGPVTQHAKPGWLGQLFDLITPF